MFRTFLPVILLAVIATPAWAQKPTDAPEATKPKPADPKPAKETDKPKSNAEKTKAEKPKPEKSPSEKPKPPKKDVEAPKPEDKGPKKDGKFAVVDPVEASKDPDFGLQGEYFGRMQRLGGGAGYEGLQVIALGNGQFEAVHYQGGLPGGGWNRVDKLKLNGSRKGETLTLDGEGVSVTIKDGVASYAAADGRALGQLARIQRVSTRQEARPPAGAIVLFDGSNADRFKDGQMTEDGLLKMGTEFVDSYRDFQLHIEFRLPYMPYARGQQRSNSGVYLQSRYEVQVLDSFGLDGVHNECAALYRQRAPDVNMCFPPLRWQTYDITYTAPRFDDEGKKVANARITVLHNGVAVHDDVEIVAKTGAGKPEGPTPLPIKLQNHGNPVVFRNIWIVDRSPAAAVAVK